MRSVWLAVCCVLLSAIPAWSQSQQDPENEKGFGLWLDQGVSTALAPNRSLDVEFYERFDQNMSNLYEYFVQGGPGFRVRPWLSVTPMYRYQRYPGSDTSYENRLLLNLTASVPSGRLRPSVRFLGEGRFPEGRVASARLRIRPGLDYTLPVRMARPPVVVINNEFFLVPGTNSFPAGGTYTQNRFQAGVRLPVTDSVSVRPYFLLQSVHPTTGWETNRALGISLALRF
jgi:hypothetical protein